MTFSQISALLNEAGLLVKDGTDGADLPVTALGCNSATATDGMLFFCKGVRFRPEYLTDALTRGAIGYLSETEYPLPASVPHLLVRDIRRAMPLIAHAFYDAPEKKVPLVGITGTKGKTSCAYQLAAIYDEEYDGKYGLISTNEALSCGKKRPKTGTTPEALDLYALLDGFVSDGAKAAVTEVSSQGLQYDRVAYLDFAVGVYLNLSPDHISPTEHKDFDEYKAAKKKLMSVCRAAVVNTDDDHGDEMLAAARQRGIPVRTVSLSDRNADYSASGLRLTPDGLTFTVRSTDRETDGKTLTLRMVGEFNVLNALCALAAARLMGISVPSVCRGLAKATVKGRMERFRYGGVDVLVDYAHNGVSFEKVFDFADRFHPGARKIVVYGCPGNKAYDRRDEMSDVAGRRADLIVLTDDDPAYEDPDEIMDQAEKMLKYHDADYRRIHDRREAVAYAVSLCRPGDLLLVLAKGHETTQIVQGAYVEYGGDQKAVADAFAAKEEVTYGSGF